MVLIDLAARQMVMMNDLYGEVCDCLKHYDKLPHRTLEFRTRSNGKTDYYAVKRENGKTELEPIGKGNNNTVVAYKQERFLREKQKILKNNIKAIKRFLSSLKDYSPEEIQKKLPLAYRDLPLSMYENIKSDYPPVITGHIPESICRDERFRELQKWAAQDYKRNPYPLPDDPNIARDGTPMRSKGECMWYDNILFEGLPVRVDPEIVLKGKSGQWHTLHPDFIFKCFDGSLILVEHFGGWGDDDYAERNKHKIQEYLDCGYVLGDNLIGTSDNADHCTNELMILEALEKIKKRMFA